MSNETRRTRTSRGLLAILCAMMLAISAGPAVCADQRIRTYHGHGVYDYYARSSYPELLLNNVLGYHVEPARDGLSTGDRGEARGNIGFILNYFPNHPLGLQLALTYAARFGDEQYARERIVEALEINPKVAWTHLVYGVFLHRQKDFSAAEQAYRKAIALDSGLADAYYNLGLMLLDMGRLKEAKTAALKAYDLGYPLPGLRLRLKDAEVRPTPGSSNTQQ